MTAHLFRLRWYTVFFLLGLLVLCTCFAGQIQAELQTAVNRCLTVIIPSLYAMMILSQLFLESGAWQALARPLRRFSTALFGLPESYFALFLLSQFAGYPVGASMLCTLTKQGVLSKEDASRLLCVCYGGGPAFLLGLLGTVSCRRTCFLLIFSANLFANLLLCFLLFHRKPISPPVNGNNAIAPFSTQMLTFAVTSAGRTLLKLCGMILCFAALTGIFQAARTVPLLHCPDAATGSVISASRSGAEHTGDLQLRGTAAADSPADSGAGRTAVVWRCLRAAANLCRHRENHFRRKAGLGTGLYRTALRRHLCCCTAFFPDCCIGAGADNISSPANGCSPSFSDSDAAVHDAAGLSGGAEAAAISVQKKECLINMRCCPKKHCIKIF